MKPAITALLDDSRLRLARGVATNEGAGIPVGYAALAKFLPWGWPVGAMTEICATRSTVSGLSLTLPALAAMTETGRYVALVGLSRLPYAPALQAAGLDLSRLVCVTAGDSARTVWSAEQLLHSNTCGAVVIWLNRAPMHRLRRLQLAAGQGDAAAFLFRPADADFTPSPASLRLRVERTPEGLHVRALKPLGGHPFSVLIPEVC